MTVKHYHEKLGMAAFVLSILGVFTVGLLVIPALICASLSKRAADRAGCSRDGFATAANVVSGCVLALWGIFISLGLVIAASRMEALGLKFPTKEIFGGVILVVGGVLGCVIAAMIGKQLAYARGKRVRRLMGRR